MEYVYFLFLVCLSKPFKKSIKKERFFVVKNILQLNRKKGESK